MSSIFLFDHDEETMSKINIDDLYEKRQKRDLKQLGIFNKILNRIHKRIQHTARNKFNRDDFIWFAVPEYLVGEPIYDKGECMGYLVSQLEKNGFFVKYMHPNTIFVSWHNWVPSYVRNEIKKKMGVIVDAAGNIINNEEPPSNPNEKSQTSANSVVETSKYQSIKNYKPSGNLVYGNDVIEKLEKKITFG
jgi:hypothetical protein